MKPSLPVNINLGSSYKLNQKPNHLDDKRKSKRLFINLDLSKKGRLQYPGSDNTHQSTFQSNM